MRLNMLARALYDPDDERCGDWNREQLIDMKRSFRRSAGEQRKRGEVKLPASPVDAGNPGGAWANAPVFVAR